MNLLEADAGRDGIIGQTATELARLIRRGELSASEVVDAHIRRIEAVNPTLNAVVVPLFDAARRAAQAADEAAARGQWQGPLHGVPVTIKEMFDVAGTPTTAGMTGRAKQLATADADAVARLRKAGAIVLGKTNVPLAGATASADNPLYGRTKNPWSLDRSTGGSSGGEVAIIAALGSPWGLGSDGGGSIRQPAHSCGVCGFKPTARRLSFHGHWSTPNFLPEWVQPGPIARCVEDLALALDVLSDPAVGSHEWARTPLPMTDFRSLPVAGLRIGYYTQLTWLRPAPAIIRAVEESARKLAAAGAIIEPFDPPHVDEAMRIYFGLFYAEGLRSLRRQLRGSVLNRDVRDLVRFAKLPSLVRPLAATATAWLGQRGVSETLRYVRRSSLSAAEYLALVDAQRAYRERFAAAWDAAQLDALICPPSPMPAFPHGEFYGNFSMIYTSLYNLLGLPAGVVPVTRVRPDEETGAPRGRDVVERCFARTEQGSAGLPVGVQVVSRWWRDEVALAVMHRVQAEGTGR